MQKADARERLRGTGKAGGPGWPNDEREQVIQAIRAPVKGKVREAKREIRTSWLLPRYRRATTSLYASSNFFHRRIKIAFIFNQNYPNYFVWFNLI